MTIPAHILQRLAEGYERKSGEGFGLQYDSMDQLNCACARAAIDAIPGLSELIEAAMVVGARCEGVTALERLTPLERAAVALRKVNQEDAA